MMPRTDYDARLDTLVQARHREGRWRRFGLWLLGAALSVPAVLGFLTLLPHTPPAPSAPVVRASSELTVLPQAPASPQTRPTPVPQASRQAPRPRPARTRAEAVRAAPEAPADTTWVPAARPAALPFDAQAFCARIGEHAATAARDRDRGWSLSYLLQMIQRLDAQLQPTPALTLAFDEIVRSVFAFPELTPEQARAGWTEECLLRLSRTQAAPPWR
jgi:hypothetical protein